MNLDTKEINIVAGIDIGGTNTAVGFLDMNNNIIFEKSFATESEKPVDLFVERLADIINTGLKTSAGKCILCGIGLAAPGVNNLTGNIEYPANFNWGSVDIIGLIKKHFNIPVRVINDANAAALGEHEFGAAKSMKNFILLTLGTGLGSGIFVDGIMLHGENGLAGEIGHTIVKSNGRDCKCGRKGCLETYVSATGLKRTVYEFLSVTNEKSELREISYENLTSKRINEMAIAGDTVALKVFKYTGKILGKAMADMTAYFDPEAIILFGGLVDADELLLKPARYYLDKNLLEIYKGRVKLLKSALQNGKAGILGSCVFIKKFINYD